MFGGGRAGNPSNSIRSINLVYLVLYDQAKTNIGFQVITCYLRFDQQTQIDFLFSFSVFPNVQCSGSEGHVIHLMTTGLLAWNCPW